MNISKNLRKEFTPFFLLCLLFIALILNNFTSSVKSGVALFYGVVLPSVFPFFFITAYLSRLNITKRLFYKSHRIFNKVFSLSAESGFVVLITLLSGYPSGAKLLSDFCENNLISRKEAERACSLASIPSPAFCVLTLGGVITNSTTFGVKAYLVCLISSFIVGLIFCKRKGTKLSPPKTSEIKDVSSAMYDSAYSAFSTALMVGTLITLFYLFTDILSHYGLLLPIEKFFYFITKNENLSKSLTFGLIESTKGLKLLALEKENFLAFPLACFMLGFSGVSIIFQSTTFLKKAKIKTAKFILSKIVSAVLCFVLGLIFNLF